MTDREADIIKLCDSVIEIDPRSTGDSGKGAECPFCFGEGKWNGLMEDMKHEGNCAYLIAKDLKIP